MAENRPQGRRRTDNGGIGSVHKRGDGLGSGPVGNISGSNNGRGRTPLGGRPGGGGGVTRGIGGMGLIAIIFMLLFGGNGGGLLGGSSGSSSSTTTAPPIQQTQQVQTPASVHNGGFSFGTPASHTTYTDGSTSAADTTVSNKARSKYTTIKGNGKDQVTVLVYMCGADLESNYGMATADLTEMAYATMSDKVNVIVETGGARKWKTNAISNKTLQRWKITDKALDSLDKNVGSASMTDPKTLEDFIKWGVKAYPANRYELIFWDHGGGSVTGYGMDELYPNGSMDINEIASALKNCGVKFDFIGFDACLMANYETAVALEPYADYLIASEETEPGTGWYYTDWLSAFAKNPSMPTLDVGKNIVDTFITACRQRSSRDSISLSVTDLAELQGTSGSVFSAFSKELKKTTGSENYTSVANARSCTKEFATHTKIDQIDLIHFCDNLGTEKSKELAKVLRSAVKYNKTYNMTNAYGLSIYFPYRNTRLVTPICNIYQNIGFDADYASAVRSFGTLSGSGQIYNNSTQNSLFNVMNGSPASNGTTVTANDLFSLLSGLSSSSPQPSNGTGTMLDLVSLLGGGSSSIDTSGLELFSQLLGRDALPAEDFVLSEVEGDTVLRLGEDDWAKVHDVGINVWVDDGEGYVDLGIDNVYEFNEYGDLIIDYDEKWVALDGNPVAYYYDTYEPVGDDDYIIRGHIPAYLNDERVNIVVEFTGHDQVVLGALKVYENGTEGKGLIELETGDVIEPICDFYTYNGEYVDSYYLGDPIKVIGEVTLNDVSLTNSSYVYCYRITDVLNNERWTPAVTK